MLLFGLMFVAVQTLAQSPISVRVISEESVNTIIWTVPAGVSCDNVSVEYSADSFFFNEIYNYPGVCGGGNTAQTYQFRHRDVPTGSSYYRIYSRTLGYSEVVSTQNREKPNRLIAFPNPFIDFASILMIDVFNPVDIYLISAQGYLISLETGVNPASYTLFRKNLTPGMYYLVVTDNRNFFEHTIVVVRD